MLLIFCTCRICRHSSPRFGAKIKLSSTKALSTSTTDGPVGILRIDELTSVPKRPDTPPKNPAKTTMTDRRSVHCRAPTAGEINMALIKITPTVCKPATTANTVIKTKSRLMRLVEKPKLSAYSGLKTYSFNSFQNKTIKTSKIIPTASN